MEGQVKMIAVVRGAPSAMVQELFRMLVDRWKPAVRVAGVIAESHGLADRACSAGFLRNISTGELFPIFRDLGAGSTACHLEGAGALAAAEAVRQDVAAGCELVVLSKFGKLEAAGRGLANAFKAAVEAQVPLLTSVSPAFEEAWAKLGGPLFSALSADAAEIDAWRQAVRSRAAIDSASPPAGFLQSTSGLIYSVTNER